MIHNETLCCKRWGAVHSVSIRKTQGPKFSMQWYDCIFSSFDVHDKKIEAGQYEREYLVIIKCCTSTMYHSISNITGTKITLYEH